MIDHLDKQTQPLPLEQKRGRGRPATGQALSNADRQRAYRERQKAQRNENESSTHKTGSVELLRERALSRGRICIEQARMIQRLEAELQELRSQLAQRNEKPAKQRKHRDDAPLKRILTAHSIMEDRRKSGELSDMDALWRFVGATLQIIEQHGLTAPK